MTGYYAANLSGERLRRCYGIAPPRVRRYLEAEIQHVASRLRPTDVVLELGCGYGRVAHRLAAIARRVVGIDVAPASLSLAQRTAEPGRGCELARMDAVALGFADGVFDAVVCIQNGVCAFGVDPAALLREAIRVVRPGGRVLVSTYSDRFWPDRLAWFEAQAAESLLGPIDRAASRDGRIVCADGFTAGRMTPAELRSLCAGLGMAGEITEVDGSSVFCEVVRGV